MVEEFSEISIAIAITLITSQITVEYQGMLEGHFSTRCNQFSGPIFWSEMSWLLIIFGKKVFCFVFVFVLLQYGEIFTHPPFLRL